MAAEDTLRSVARVIGESGLVPSGSPGVALISGGADSTCLAAGLAEHCGRPNVHALHLNYGLRPSADADEHLCRRLCAMLRIDLRVERVSVGGGNVQAAARELRYEAAERLRERLGCEWVATGHTRTDLAETVLYRLASSPGRRALLGMPGRRGRVVRPMLGLERDEARRIAVDAGLPFADDPTNLDPSFARNRIRSEVLPVLREINPAAERNLAETRIELAEEGRVLDRVVEEALDAAGAGDGAVAIRAERLAGAEPGLRRLALRTLAERAAGAEVALPRARVAEIWRLAGRPEGGEVDLGGGLVARCEQGMIRFGPGVEREPEPVSLRVPGTARFGPWDVRAELHRPPVEMNGPERAILDRAMLGGGMVVRTWREGDRIRPLGMDGTKTLGDLFTDTGVPRSLRHKVPVVAVGERIAWVAGVAVSEEFRLHPTAGEAVILSASIRDQA